MVALRRVAALYGTRHLSTFLYEQGRSPGEPSAGQITRAFGTWSAACRAAGLRRGRPGRVPLPVKTARRYRFTDADLKQNVRDVAELAHTTCPTIQQYQKFRIPGLHAASSTIIARLGPWPEVVRSVGLLAFKDVSWRPQEQVFADMRKVAARLGVTSLSRAAYDRGRSPSMLTSTAIRARFGSWSLACRKAGLRAGRAGRPAVVADLVLLDQVWEVAVLVGDPMLPIRVYNTHRDKAVTFGATGLIKRFGSWLLTLERAGLGVGAPPDWASRRPSEQ